MWYEVYLSVYEVAVDRSFTVPDVFRPVLVLRYFMLLRSSMTDLPKDSVVSLAAFLTSSASDWHS